MCKHYESNTTYMQDRKELNGFIKEVFGALRKHGVRKVTKKLRELTIDAYSDEKQKIIDFIIFKIYEAYGVTAKELKTSTKRGTVTEARQMGYLLFKKYFNISQTEIAIYFGRNGNMVVSKFFQKFKVMDRKIKRERDFLDTYDTIITHVDNFKKEMIVKYATENNYGT